MGAAGAAALSPGGRLAAPDGADAALAAAFFGGDRSALLLPSPSSVAFDSTMVAVLCLKVG